MRKTLTVLGSLAVTSALLTLAPAHATSAPTAGGSGPAAGPAGHGVPVSNGAELASSPIQHVVIIYQENHAFDDVLGAVCEQRTNPCNGYTGPVTFADGVTADNIVQPDVVPIIVHDPDSQQLALDDNWDQINGCETPPYSCISHSDPANIPNLAALADTFTVSDATFAAGHSASFGAHVTLAAGTFDGYLGYNPVASVTGAKPRNGWGCQSRLDDLWSSGHGNPSYQPACIPTQSGQGPYRKTKVPYTPTIMEQMESAGLSWHLYEGESQTKPPKTNFSICTYFAWCWLDRFNLQYESSYADFLSAASSGTLPNLSILIPDGGLSQHNGTSMTKGDNYIGEMANAVMNGPEWDSTALFITYDDCGCFYDHVTPPPNLGLRNPMVIVSPWAKADGVDSATAVQPYSMLSFVDAVFGMPPLSANVGSAYDYSGAFDFSQEPLAGPRMTHTKISAQERRELAKLAPMVEDDPT